MISLTKLNSVDSILSDFHRSVTNLQALIDVREQQVSKAAARRDKAHAEYMAHQDEIIKAGNAITKIKAFLE